MRKRVLAACLLPLLLVAAAACTKSDDGKGVASVNGTATPSVTPSLSMLDQAIRHSQCMREHGVPVSDPQPVQDGFVTEIEGSPDEDALNKAEEECRQYDPFQPNGAETANKMQRGLEYARCMREHGVENFPDPAGGSFLLNDPIRQDPQYEQANATCRAQVGASSQPSSKARGDGK